MKTLMYVCPVCGNVMIKLVDSGVTPHCCGKEMHLLRPEMREEPGVSEKHLPSVSLADESTLRVQVGSELHPMSPEHRIDLILLETERGVQVRLLKPDDKPTARFYAGFDKPKGVYIWCNRHGLWGTEHLPPTVKRPSSCCTRHSC